MDRQPALEEFWDAIPEAWKNSVTNYDHGVWASPLTPQEMPRLKKAVKALQALDKADRVPYTQVMDAMREHAGVAYRKPVSPKYAKHIRVLWSKGYRLPDFIRVFKAKYADWGDDPKWSKFLRPSTLLRNFEDYHAVCGNSKRERPALHRAEAKHA